MRKILSLIVFSVVLFTTAIACVSSAAAESHVHLYQYPHEVTRYVSISRYQHHRYKQNIATCVCGHTKDMDSPHDHVAENHQWIVTSSGKDANGNIYYIAHCSLCLYDATLYQ